ncbi:MAG: flagellar motor protein MotB [Desulfobacteraceae bacterium]|nr:MAG: flagellar motor protein MotB [Desulfobacteraceae bacterium]
MGEENNNPVIIVVKKKNGHGGHHGGAWKVAYADFVTAMMALFIVLWIVGQSKEVKQAISGYFKDPGVFTSGSAGGILPDAQKPMPLPPPPVEVEVEVDKRVSEMEELKAEAAKISGTIAQTPEFSRFADKIKVTVTDEGLRIDLVEESEGLFFDIGKAHIKSETVKLLQVIAKAHLSPLKNSIIIEGYTDARPYANAGYSNWDLSADRANSARKVLEEGGLRKDQILEVRGFADRKLMVPDKPFDYSNRRVSILLPLINTPGKTPKPEAQLQAPGQPPAGGPAANLDIDIETTVKSGPS